MPNKNTAPQDGRPALGAGLGGALAGALGGLAMLAAERIGSATLLPAGERASGGGDAARAIAGRRDAALSPGRTQAAGAGLELGYGALLGTIYGAVQSRVPAPNLVRGLLLGGLSYAVTNTAPGLLPRLGARPPMTEQNLEHTQVSVLSHVAYGLATAAAFGALSEPPR